MHFLLQFFFSILPLHSEAVLLVFVAFLVIRFSVHTSLQSYNPLKYDMYVLCFCFTVLLLEMWKWLGTSLNRASFEFKACCYSRMESSMERLKSTCWNLFIVVTSVNFWVIKTSWTGWRVYFKTSSKTWMNCSLSLHFPWVGRRKIDDNVTRYCPVSPSLEIHFT